MILSKYTVYSIIIQCICYNILLADETLGQKQQRLKEVYITMNAFHDAPLENIFSNLELKTNFTFNYDIEDLQGESLTIGKKASKVNLYDYLLEVAERANLRFKRINENIHVSMGDKPKRRLKEKFLTEIVWEKEISGKVTDENGAELPGVNVLVKGTDIGTITDVNGNFSLKAPDDASVLVFSYVGYITEEVEIEGRSVVNLSLTPDLSTLSEVVIVGYGTQRKQELTGAVSSIKGEQVSSAVTGNPTQALIGRATGVRVEINGGAPGAGANVIIRGTGSLSNQDPLYVIDGVFSDNMNFINPSDIESIEVLKDASTASIYGARSGQGVIIITTKKGSEGQPMSVDFDASWGMAQAVRQLDFLNAREYIANREQAFNNDGTPLPGNFYDFDPNVDSDIQDASLRTALTQNYGVRISGGGRQSTYSISANRLDQEGIVRASDFERTAFRLNSSLRKGRFNLNQSLFLARSINRPNTDFGSEFGHIPVVPIRDETLDGGFAAANTGVAGISRSANWLGVALLTERKNTNDNILGNLGSEFEITDGLSYKLNLSINYGNNRNFTFAPTYFTSNSDVGLNPVADLSDNRSTFVSTIVENLLTYNKRFNNHNIDLLAGYSEQKDNTETIGVEVENFLSNDTRTINAGSDFVSRTGASLPRKIRSIFGRVNYNYSGKYLFSASVRRDGSSNFGEKNRFGVFPSVAAGWNISEESFFKLPFIDDLKIRASWGKLGSDNLAPFQYVTALNITSQYTLGTSQGRENGVAQIQFSNPDLKWEETATTDIGLEGSLLEGKIDFTIDYFKKTSEDILVSLPVNPTSGTNVSIPFNAATVENAGWELSVTYKKATGDFQYALTGNFSTLNNEVIDLGEGVNPIRSGQYTDETFSATRTEAGFPVAYFYGYKTNGVYQNQDEIDADGLSGRSAVPGDLRFVDLNGDKILDANDQTLLGSPIPDFEYSLNFDVTYKGFDLAVFLQGVEGNEIWNGRLFEGVFVPNGSKRGIVRDAWRPDNPSDIPRATIGDPGVNRRESDFYVEDGAYLRLRNVTLGYTFPPSLIEKLTISKLRAYVNVENAFIIDSYSGYYPEIGRNVRRGDDLFNRGVDENVYPVPRTITFGVQVSL